MNPPRNEYVFHHVLSHLISYPIPHHHSTHSIPVIYSSVVDRTLNWTHVYITCTHPTKTKLSIALGRGSRSGCSSGWWPRGALYCTHRQCEWGCGMGVNKMYVHCHGSSETKVLFRNGRATNCGPVWPQSTFAQCVPVIIIIRVKLSTKTDHPHIRTEGVRASVRGMLTGTVTTTIMMMWWGSVCWDEGMRVGCGFGWCWSSSSAAAWNRNCVLCREWVAGWMWMRLVGWGEALGLDR